MWVAGITCSLSWETQEHLAPTPSLSHCNSPHVQWKESDTGGLTVFLLLLPKILQGHEWMEEKTQQVAFQTELLAQRHMHFNENPVHRTECSRNSNAYGISNSIYLKGIPLLIVTLIKKLTANKFITHRVHRSSVVFGCVFLHSALVLTISEKSLGVPVIVILMQIAWPQLDVNGKKTS